MMEVNILGNVYNVIINKKNNKNTYIRVKNGDIIVSTNYFTTKKSIEKLIYDNIDSIFKMLEKDKKRSYKNQEFYYFGVKYEVIYGFSNIEFSDNKIYVYDQESLNKYISNEIYRIFSERLSYWYSVFEERLPNYNMKIRKMKTRWGVCNIKNHNITLNSELSKYDISCLDYVIVHELSHFIHPNHSKDFWLLVGKYYPKYKECRLMLKE